MQTNNKLREALETTLKTIRGVINGTISPRSNTVFDCRDKLSAALDTPTRNCDVGTAEEQSKRYDEFCDLHDCRSDCPLFKNASTLRVALLAIREAHERRETPHDILVLRIIDDALAAPPRNCDVGTAKEQLKRYNKFCCDHRSYERCCGGCPLNGEPCCELAWAQMPY